MNRVELPPVIRFAFGEGRKRQLGEWEGTFTACLAVATSIFIIWSVYTYPQPLVQRSISLGLFMVLTLLLYTTPGSDTVNKIPWYDWALSLVAVSVGVYMNLNLGRLLYRYAFVDSMTVWDLIFGSVTVLLLMECTRRIIGPWLSIINGIAVGYVFLGFLIPGRFGHTGFSYSHFIDELFLTTDGIWNNTLGVATSQVVIFIIFGVFLIHSGAGKFILDFASSIAGWRTGGLAKVAVITSGLFGTVSGSPIANVSSMGSITIPMMKKSGYPAYFAAAVECCSSAGGVLMPPVMGSVAFIMAEVIGVPYREVAIAAFLPAIIYYFAIYFTVDFRARKLGLKGLDKSELQPLASILRNGVIFFIPIIYLVLRLVFSGANPSRIGVEAVCVIYLCSLFPKGNKMDFKKIFQALEDGACKGIMIATTMAACGIIIGVINLTGLGAKFSSYLMALSNGSIIATLFTIMCLAMFLGLALNISTAYLLTAVVAGPALVNMGVPIMAAHMFILFYAAMATITPPVALSAFVAASIAEAPPMQVGFQAMRITLVGYLLPYFFVFSPSLLMEGSWVKITVSFISGICAVALISMGLEGWWYKKNVKGVYRVCVFIAGIMALSGNIYLIILSFAIAGTVFLKGCEIPRLKTINKRVL